MPTEIEDRPVNSDGLGFAVMFSLIGIGLIIVSFATFIFGACFPASEGYTAPEGTLHLMIANGWIWGAVYGLIVLMPLIYKIIGSVMDYREHRQPEHSQCLLFIGLGNLFVFNIYGIGVTAIAEYVYKVSGTYIDTAGLSIAVLVNVILFFGAMITIHVIDGKNMKRIIEDNNLFENEVKQNE